ncbi:MAG: AraC family transcriptional regulator [Microbacteriaceae bacterium]|nr:AraC family transcriptional regulator [Microbacteriaceae bacterium]
MSTLLDTAPPTDSLDDLIARLRWTVTAYDSQALEARQRQTFTGTLPTFHYIVEGESVVAQGEHSVGFRAGDFVLLPRGGVHTITAEGSVRFFSGTMSVDSGWDEASGPRLPDLLMACRLLLREPLVVAMLRGMEAEHASKRLAGSAVMTRLANVVATSAIRAWAESECAASDEDWLVSLRDPNIALALEAIHREPGSPWTVSSLAMIARSSRSRFSETFRAEVGDSPARYLTRVRMERALRMLQDGSSVGQAAFALGYGSDEAFSRAFRRHTGRSPSTVRGRTA